MTSQGWLDHFRRNQLGRSPIPWQEPIKLPLTGRAVILRSLACFQLGESSDGRHLRRLAWTTGDAEYAQAIELFIAEEQEHARLLGVILDRFAVPRLRRHWSHLLFRHCRHLAGFRAEIVVLLMAELSGLTYYAALRDGIEDTALRRVCEHLLRDEQFHIRFHCEYLYIWLADRSRLTRTMAWCGLGLLFAGAMSVVAWGHRDALVAMGETPRRYRTGAWLTFAAARRSIFTGETFAAVPSDSAAIHPVCVAAR